MSRSHQTNQEVSNKTSNEVSHPKRKMEGNSQFIKSRFDKDYNPKLRVFKSLSAYNSSFEQKKKSQLARGEEIAALINKTQQEVKQGKKIIIDWSHNNNFRTTRFPAVDNSFSFPKRANTEQIIVNSLDSPKNVKYYQYLARFQNNSGFKKIATKGQLLRDLLSESTLQKRKSRKHSKKLRITTCDQKNLLQSGVNQNQSERRNIHSSKNNMIIEEVQQRERQFFAQNQNKIQKAINYEKHLQNLSICVSTNKRQQKMKIEQIHQRIICKSKLTLLKMDLAKKFKQIREEVLEEAVKSSTKKSDSQ